jgi:hypothetical protein
MAGKEKSAEWKYHKRLTEELKERWKEIKLEKAEIMKQRGNTLGNYINGCKRRN